MSKKKIAAILAVCAIAACVTGCGKEEPKETVPDETEVVEEMQTENRTEIETQSQESLDQELEERTKKDATEAPYENIKEQNNTQAYGSPIEDWKDMSIVIDNAVYQYPYDFKTMYADGWKIMGFSKLAEEELLVNNKYGNHAILCKETYFDGAENINDVYEAYDNNRPSMEIECFFKGPDEKSIPMLSGDIVGINVRVNVNPEDETLPEFDTRVLLANDITIGSTREEILEAYGEPTEDMSNPMYVPVNMDNTNSDEETEETTEENEEDIVEEDMAQGEKIDTVYWMKYVNDDQVMRLTVSEKFGLINFSIGDQDN